MPERYQHVSVLKGGPGDEREVSLRSGAAVASALREAGYQVEEVDVKRLDFVLPEGTEAVFPALHGEFGEDGMAQRRLEELGLPYVGSRSWEMPRSFDKEIAQALLVRAGLPVAPSEILTGDAFPRMVPPLVLKAPRQGSSIGVEVVMTPDALPEALARVRPYGPRILVEQFIAGRECTVAFLGNEPLPIVEISPREGRYDYEAKYQRDDTVYRVPAPFPDDWTRRILDLARGAWDVLGGRHLGRVDFRVTEDGDACILELNPLPGFTATSLLPKAAAAAGIGFSPLCELLMEMAE